LNLPLYPLLTPYPFVPRAPYPIFLSYPVIVLIRLSSKELSSSLEEIPVSTREAGCHTPKWEVGGSLCRCLLGRLLCGWF
jgi:hypothetical protein